MQKANPHRVGFFVFASGQLYQYNLRVMDSGFRRNDGRFVSGKLVRSKNKSVLFPNKKRHERLAYAHTACDAPL
jgi:hypothetical protein